MCRISNTINNNINISNIPCSIIVPDLPTVQLLTQQSHSFNIPHVTRHAKSWKCPTTVGQRKKKIALNLCAQNLNAVLAAPQRECNRTRFINFRSISCENCIAGYHFNHGCKKNSQGCQVWQTCQPYQFLQDNPAFLCAASLYQSKKILKIGRSGRHANRTAVSL